MRGLTMCLQLLIELFVAGGIVMIPLLVFSLLAIVLIIERLVL